MAERRAKRFQPAGPITVGFLGTNTRFRGELVDISSTGILIRCSQELEPGTMGRLGFELGQEVVRIVVVARRRIPGLGMAFEFRRMTSRDRQMLHRLLYRLAQLCPSESRATA